MGATTDDAKELVDQIKDQQQVLAAAQAKHATLMLKFSNTRRTLDQQRITSMRNDGADPRYQPGEFAALEIGLAINTNKHKISRTIGIARRLHDETPDAWDAWQAGHIDHDRAARINKALIRLTRDTSKQLLNALVVDVAKHKTVELLGRWLNEFVAQVEPDQTNDRLRRSLEDRYVSIRPDIDGISFLHAAIASADADAINHERGGDDQPVVAGEVLSVVALQKPPPRTGISRESGSVMLRTGPGPLRIFSIRRPGDPPRRPAPCRLELGLRLAGPGSVSTLAASGGAARPRPVCPAAYRASRRRSWPPGGPDPGQVLLRHRHRRRDRRARSAARTAAGPGTLGPDQLRRLLRFPLGRQARPAQQRSARPALRRPRMRQHLIPADPPRTAHPRRRRSPRARRVSAGQFPQLVLGPVRRLRRRRGDLHPVQRDRPSLPMPSRAHSTSTSVKNAAAASGKPPRNRANVT